MIENPITYLILALLVFAFIVFILYKRTSLRPMGQPSINRQVSGCYNINYTK